MLAQNTRFLSSSPPLLQSLSHLLLQWYISSSHGQESTFKLFIVIPET